MKKIIQILRPRTIVVYGLATIAGCLLLHTSQNVQIQQDRRNELTLALDREQARTRTLLAEWAYLNSPERLERLSGIYLPAPLENAPSAILQMKVSEIPLPAPDPVPALIAAAHAKAESSSQEARR